MAKGIYGPSCWHRRLDGTFARLQAGGAEIMQEPIEQDWGARDCAIRDPAGNMIRIQELR